MGDVQWFDFHLLIAFLHFKQRKNVIDDILMSSVFLELIFSKSIHCSNEIPACIPAYILQWVRIPSLEKSQNALRI